MSLSIKPVLLVPCALASLVLVACGGSGSSPNAGTKTDNEQQTLNFTRCMREHGVNISTPNGPGGGPINVTGTSPQVMEAAQKACARYRPQGGPEKLSPAERAAREDAVQSFARCMRSHGVEVQAQTQGGAVRIGVHANAKENPAFQAAQKACEGYLPKPPGGRLAGGFRGGAAAGAPFEAARASPRRLGQVAFARFLRGLECGIFLGVVHVDADPDRAALRLSLDFDPVAAHAAGEALHGVFARGPFGR